MKIWELNKITREISFYCLNDRTRADNSRYKKEEFAKRHVIDYKVK